MNNAGGTTISGGNLSVDGNKITKVAQGTDGTDAVNVDQLNAVAAKKNVMLNLVTTLLMVMAQLH